MNSPIIILFQTQLGENIGMCARAMLNCGLSRLRLVAPRDGWPNHAARATAADADQVLDNAECFDTLEEAISDCHRLYATTARSRARELVSLDVCQAAVEIARLSNPEGDNAEAQTIGVLFGPEASGLDNQALSRADCLIHFPVNPAFGSLNLAQAVFLVAWEWWKLASTDVSRSQDSGTSQSIPAVKKEWIGFMDRLESELDAGGYFLSEQLRPESIGNLRAFFGRATPTEQELRMLHGVVTALKKHRGQGAKEIGA